LLWIKKSLLDNSIKAVATPEKIKFTAKKMNVFFMYLENPPKPNEIRTMTNAPESFMSVSRKGFIGGRKIRSE
jgi:hypothetical protein